MKVLVEKVPEGLRLSFTPDASKKPTVLVIQPPQLETYIAMLRTAMKAESFKVELQT